MLPRATFKSRPEDFVVDEIPAYEPSGSGEHLYVRFTKRLLTTDEAVRAIGGALGIRPREIGVAGLKDKVGVTTQTISLPFPVPRTPVTAEAFVERARALALPGIAVLDAKAHGNKLKTGHLAGNRFAVRLRGIDPGQLAEVTLGFERIGREGLPNAFGAQRFGREGDNAERARAWLSGKSQAPRDPRLRRLLWSALQSDAFNAVLQARVDDGTWRTPLFGDLVKRRTSGGLFLCADVQEDQARAERGEVSPTGPIVGVKMRAAEGEPGRLEERILAERLQNVNLAATKALGEGTRRALRLWVEDLRIQGAEADEGGGEQEQGVGIWVYFVLPKGAYATTVLSAVVDGQVPEGIRQTRRFRPEPSADPARPGEADPSEASAPEAEDAEADAEAGE